MMDFELAIVQAIDEVFPSTQTTGCYFHFVNNLWKNFQCKIGRDKLKDESMRKSLRYLSSLPFFPIDDVVEAFEFVKAESSIEFKPMIDYFEPTYIGVNALIIL